MPQNERGQRPEPCLRLMLEATPCSPGTKGVILGGNPYGLAPVIPSSRGTRPRPHKEDRHVARIAFLVRRDRPCLLQAAIPCWLPIFLTNLRSSRPCSTTSRRSCSAGRHARKSWPVTCPGPTRSCSFMTFPTWERPALPGHHGASA